MITVAAWLALIFAGRTAAANSRPRASATRCRFEVERGAHDEDALGHRLREGVDELLHLVKRPVEIIVRRVLVAAVDGGGRVAAGAEHLAFGHQAGFDQIVEHDVGARAGGRQVDVRRELASAP